MKQKTVVFLILQFFFQLSYSQIKGIIVEKGTDNPVAYANIWVENQNINVSAKEDGTFIIDKKDLTGKFLIVTSLAHEKQKVEITDKLYKVELVPITYQLREAVIKVKKKRIKSDNWGIIYIAKFPYFFARYYPYLPTYGETPYLTEITFGIGTEELAKYRFRLLSVNDKGEPGDDLIPDQSLFIVKKGNHVVDADIEKYYIKIPDKGFFVGFELISEKKEQSMGVDLRIVPYDDKSTWTYINGAWSNEPHPALRAGSFFQAQFNLTLSK